MKISICFFGATTMLDRFMTQNVTRCVLSPLSRYFHDKVDFFYCAHSYMGVDTLKIMEVLNASFPLSVLTLHDRQTTLQHKPQSNNQEEFLRDYSLQRVKKMWKSSFFPAFDLIVCVCLDLLFSKPLSDNDIALVRNNKNNIFVAGHLPEHFLMGSMDVMNVFADRVDHDNTNSSFYETIRSTHNIRVSVLSVVFVRVMPDGLVCFEDCRICPYLNDLITSSSTKIRISKKKSSSRK